MHEVQQGQNLNQIRSNLISDLEIKHQDTKIGPWQLEEDDENTRLISHSLSINKNVKKYRNIAELPLKLSNEISCRYFKKPYFFERQQKTSSLSQPRKIATNFPMDQQFCHKPTPINFHSNNLLIPMSNNLNRRWRTLEHSSMIKEEKKKKKKLIIQKSSAKVFTDFNFICLQKIKKKNSFDLGQISHANVFLPKINK